MAVAAGWADVEEAEVAEPEKLEWSGEMGSSAAGEEEGSVAYDEVWRGTFISCWSQPELAVEPAVPGLCSAIEPKLRDLGEGRTEGRWE